MNTLTPFLPFLGQGFIFYQASAINFSFRVAWLASRQHRPEGLWEEWQASVSLKMTGMVVPKCLSFISYLHDLCHVHRLPLLLFIQHSFTLAPYFIKLNLFVMGVLTSLLLMKTIPNGHN